MVGQSAARRVRGVMVVKVELDEAIYVVVELQDGLGVVWFEARMERVSCGESKGLVKLGPLFVVWGSSLITTDLCLKRLP